MSFTTSEGTWVALDVTADGQSLVMELLGDIYTLPVEGGQARPLVTGKAFQAQPRVSPDGSQLAFVSDESGSDNVWIAEIDGSNPRALTTETEAGMLSPAWSADGSTIYVTVLRSEGFSSSAEVWRYDVDSGVGERVVENRNGLSQPLVSAPAPGPYGPVPAPSGLGLYYTSVTPRPYGRRDGPSSEIVWVDSQSGQSHSMVLAGGSPMKPALTRDGRRLVYGAVREGRTGLKVRDLGSGEERWLAYPIQRHQLESRATRDVLPNFAITPDSRFVFAAWGGRIRRIDLETGAEQEIPFEVDVNLSVTPRLHFPKQVPQGPVRARRVQQLAVAPDGRTAFSALGRLWIADGDGANPRRLTRTQRPREFMPAWSPDGQWLAYVTWDEIGGHVWKARSDGSGEPERLSTTPALWADPAWTPDGSEIVALMAPLSSARTAGGPGQGLLPSDAVLMALSVDGGVARTVAQAPGLRRPHFGPADGRVYLSGAGRGLVSMGLRGGDVRTEAVLEGARRGGELRICGSGTHIMAVGGAAQVFEVPEGGLNGEALTDGQALPLAVDHAGLAAWDGGCDNIAGVSGVRLIRWATGSLQGAPEVRTLSFEVPRARPTGSVVLRGGTLLTMNGYEVIEEADLVVTDNRIAALGPSGTVNVPEGAAVIDVTGKVIVPGFIDIHAHFANNGELPAPESTTSFANLAYGITSLRNPQTPPDVFGYADMVEADGVPAPRIFSTGPGLFSQRDYATPEEARQAIEPYAQAFGTHLLKWYLGGTRQERQSVISAARALEMMPTTEGGADTKGNVTYAVDGFSGLEHAFPVAPIHDDLVQLVARTGITYTPTLGVAFGAALPIFRMHAEQRPHQQAKATRWFADGELYENSSKRLLWFPPEDYNDIDVAAGANAILRAGGNVALGGHGEVQGLSNHWEMELLARGGMSNHDVLRVATVFGSNALGYEGDLGMLAAGKLADLVVLNRDPLTDITATQDIAFVMKNGVLFDGTTLDEVWPERVERPLPWRLQRPKESGATIAAVEAHVRSTMAAARIPGMAVAVVRNGEVLSAKGFGVANLETGTEVTDQTMFQSGSLGKQFAAAGMMVLVEQGRVDLDDSVRGYIPEAPDSWAPITIRHLLTHSSGIPDYTSDDFDYETHYSEDDLVRMAADLDLEFEAGARWNYSNTGYVMLGVIMSRLTGRPYWEFLREHVFDPAGMPTIRINTQTEIVPHRAVGYLPTPNGWTHAGHVAETTNTTADGSLLLSLRDLIAWNRFVAEQRLLSAESWGQILSPMTLISGRTHPYGFGWFIEEAGGQVVHQHGGTWQGFVTQFTRYARGDLAILVLSNARSLAVPGLPRAIATQLDPELAPPPRPTTPIADPHPEATRYVSEMLAKVARGELVLDDFDFVRQTLFPRIRAALAGQLQGMGPPDRLDLLSSSEEGDDLVLEYWAWYGERRYRVFVSLGPAGGLTALRVVPETPR